MESLGLLSPDGRCYSFDSRANGFGRGEGIGVLLIKPLSEAVRQGDMIRAVIRSAASNHDGTSPRFDQPNIDSQSLLIGDTYLKAGLGLDETRYFEANGQGTYGNRVTYPRADFQQGR